MTTEHYSYKRLVPGVSHWTDYVKLNKSFADRLKRITYDPKCGRNPVTNKDAYEVYVLYHSTKYTFDPNSLKRALEHDETLKANVRSQLCKMEHLGMLRRVKPGLYEWVK